MGKSLRNITHEPLVVLVDGQALDSVESIEWNSSPNTETLRAGGGAFPYATIQYGQAIEGSITLRYADTAVLQKLFGGTALTSGIQFTIEETINASSIYSALGNAAVATPLQSGFIMVKSADGTKLFTESKTGSPAAGEFAYLGVTGIKFASADNATSVKATYGVFNASGQGWDYTETATPSYVSIVVVPKQESRDTSNIVNAPFQLPKARFNAISDTLNLGTPGSLTFNFSAVADGNGRAIRFFTASG